MTQKRKLNTYVGPLYEPETSRAVMFGPDDEVPDWAAEQIKSPGVWEKEVPVKGATSTPKGEGAPSSGEAGGGDAGSKQGSTPSTPAANPDAK
jgi:hypothetical protein